MDKHDTKDKKSRDDHDIDNNKHNHGSSHGMAGCFEPIRPRTSSFDLHLLMHHNKLTKIGRLFRSRSEGNVKSSPSPSPKSSPKMSPRGSPAPGEAPSKRRFMRVIRDDQSSGEEYENPHVIRKYSKKYAETLCLHKSQSLDEHTGKLPYTVPENTNTILKKYSSFESPSVSQVATPDHSPPSSKHASFMEEIEVIEYDKKEKIRKHKFSMHREKLSFDEVDSEDTSCSITELSFQTCSLDEVSEQDEYDMDPEDQDDVFQFDEDQKLPQAEGACGETTGDSTVTNSPTISRQLSSDSDASDSDRPSRKKKTKFTNDEVISCDSVSSSEVTKKAQSTRSAPQKIEVEP